MTNRLRLHRTFTGLTNLVFSILGALLLLRFIFKLFAANSQAPFVDWLYRTTDILNSLFRGIFETPVIDGRFVFDITTLISLVLYALFFSLIMYLFDFAFGVERE